MWPRAARRPFGRTILNADSGTKFRARLPNISGLHRTSAKVRAHAAH
jgi:hypothetical protein